MSLTINCARCGHPMTLDDEAAAAFMRVGGSASAEHAPGECPHERAAAESVPIGPRVRRFVARVEIVEEVGDDEEDVITRFTARASAMTSAAAMRPGTGSLWDQFAEQWSTVAEQVGFADLPATDPPGGA